MLNNTVAHPAFQIILLSCLSVAGSQLVSPGHTCMSQWSVITCPRLQQQGTRQLTGTNEVCLAKEKFLFSRENLMMCGKRIFVGVALFFFFLNTAKQLRACSIQTGENFETLRFHLSKTSFPQVCPQPSVPKINHSW